MKRDELFKSRMKQTAALSKYFGFSISDIDALSIEEVEYYLEYRANIIKTMK